TSPNVVIASAAKQSILSLLGEMDCFVARAPRNDAVGVLILFKQQIRVRVLAAGGARAMHVVVPPKKREQGMPDARCTRGLVCKWKKKAHTSIQGSGGNPTFPAQWLYGLYRAHPGVSGVLAPVASRKPATRPGRAFAPPKDLTPTIEASGPHDFAVRFSTARQHALKTAHGVYPALQS